MSEESTEKMKQCAGNDYEILTKDVNPKEKMSVLCKKCNTIFNPTTSNFLAGTRCPKCKGGIKLSNEEFKEKIQLLYDGNIVPNEEYRNRNSRISCSCKICGTDFSGLPSSMLNGMASPCPVCLTTKRCSAKNNKYDMQTRLDSLYPNRFTIIEYTKYGEKTIILDNDCKHEYKTSTARVLAGRGCPKCLKELRGREKRLDQTGLMQKVINFIGDRYSFKDIIFNKEKHRTEIILTHSCGNIVALTSRDLFRKKERKYCNNCKPTKTKEKEWFIEKIKELTGEEYNILSDNNFVGKKVRLRHNNCGNEFDMIFGAFLGGQRCPKCAKKPTSNLEKELALLLEKIYTGKIERNIRFKKEGKSFLELDFFLPEINLGIEFDGLYWHSNIFKPKFSLEDKNKFFNRKNIDVIHIFNDEFIKNQNQIENFLKERISPKEMVCESIHPIIRPISNLEFDLFYKENNFTIEKRNIGKKLGCFINNNIVSILSTYKLNDGTISIRNFVSKDNYACFLSEFIKYFKNVPSLKKLRINLDKRFYNIENFVSLNNFSLIRELPAKKWYLLKNFSVRSAKSSAKNEKFIYDCGYYEYELIL